MLDWAQKFFVEKTQILQANTLKPQVSDRKSQNKVEFLTHGGKIVDVAIEEGVREQIGRKSFGIQR